MFSIKERLLDETLHLVCSFLQEFTGGFQTEGGGEEESVGGTELDCTCSHLDDEHPLVIFHHLKLVITEVEDVVDGLGGECPIGRHQELGSRFLVSQDDGTSLAGDGVDPEILGEGHASVGVGGYLLGGQSDRGGDDGGQDVEDVFHNVCGFQISIDSYRLDFLEALGREDSHQIPECTKDGGGDDVELGEGKDGIEGQVQGEETEEDSEDEVDDGFHGSMFFSCFPF